MKVLWKAIKVVVGLFIALIVVAAFVGSGDHAPRATTTGGAEKITLGPPLPPNENGLIVATDHGSAAYDAGANDMAKGASRPARAREICTVIRPLAVQNWFGTVEALSSNSDGKGVLSVRLSPIVTVATWNNSLSDFQDHTLIEPTSALFNTAVALKVGDRVQFSGSFLASQTDCIEEHSMTLRGSMEEPEFIFRFAAIQALK